MRIILVLVMEVMTAPRRIKRRRNEISPLNPPSDTVFSLPDGIQTAVCNYQIQIADPLYALFWPGGDWCVALFPASVTPPHCVFYRN